MGDTGGAPIEDPDERHAGLTRRQALKRGAIFGGALVWATPIVQVVGMKPAFAQVPSGPTTGDCVVVVRTGSNTTCFSVTQAVCDCFDEECAGESGELGCLNRCHDIHGVGHFEEIPCPT